MLIQLLLVHLILIFIADSNSQQAESNEDDNTSVQGITLQSADLTVTDLTAPVTAEIGSTIEITWEVTNEGHGTATQNWQDKFYLSSDETLSNDDQLLLTKSITSGLSSEGKYNQTENITLPLDGSITEGSYYLLAVTDRNHQQIESDETNNQRSIPLNITIPPLPDLIVSEITLPNAVFSGQDIEILWMITNQGTADATGTWTDKVYLSSDQEVGGDRHFGNFNFTGTLSAGESIERRQLISLPVDFVGDYYAVVTTDGNDHIFEYSGENNNSKIADDSLTITLLPLPNLQVSSVTSPATAFSSQEVVIEWAVTNNGTASTSAPSWRDKVWLSLDQNLDQTDTYLGQVNNPSFLRSGDSYNNQLTATLPRGIDGNYYFIVQTDTSNQVNELGNEDDNQGVSDATDVTLTPPPDFSVTSIQAPSQGFSGQPLSVTWQVTNIGNCRSRKRFTN